MFSVLSLFSLRIPRLVLMIILILLLRNKHIGVLLFTAIMFISNCYCYHTYFHCSYCCLDNPNSYHWHHHYCCIITTLSTRRQQGGSLHFFSFLMTGKLLNIDFRSICVKKGKCMRCTWSVN